jgi:uncharacterized SAM-binding protein YcdF (DUF218 family)
MEPHFREIALAVMLPPGGPLVIALAGLGLWGVRLRTGRALAAIGIISLTLLSLPAVGRALLGLIEPRETLDPGLAGKAQALVILGGGTAPEAREYEGDSANATTLERLRYGARLIRQAPLPVLVSGGNPQGNRTSEAAQMRAVLTDEFRVPVNWIEDKANNTYESARNCRDMLAAAGIERIVLVTHASHMRRARLAFESYGFSVVPAPTGFSDPARPAAIDDFLPGVEGLRMSRIFFYETIGYGWYDLRAKFARQG